MADGPDLQIKIVTTVDNAGATEAKKTIQETVDTAKKGAKEAGDETEKWGIKNKHFHENFKKLKHELLSMPGLGPLFAVALNPIAVLTAGVTLLVKKCVELGGAIKDALTFEAPEALPRTIGDAQKLAEALRLLAEAGKQSVKNLNDQFEEQIKLIQEIQEHEQRLTTIRRDAEMAAAGAEKDPLKRAAAQGEITARYAGLGLPSDQRGPAIDAEIARQRGMMTAAGQQMGQKVEPIIAQVRRVRAADQAVARAQGTAQTQLSDKLLLEQYAAGQIDLVFLPKHLRDRLAGEWKSQPGLMNAMQAARTIVAGMPSERHQIQTIGGFQATARAERAALQQMAPGVGSEAQASEYVRRENARQEEARRTASERIWDLEDRRGGIARGRAFASSEGAARSGGALAGPLGELGTAIASGDQNVLAALRAVISAAKLAADTAKQARMEAENLRSRMDNGQ